MDAIKGHVPCLVYPTVSIRTTSTLYYGTRTRFVGVEGGWRPRPRPMLRRRAPMLPTHPGGCTWTVYVLVTRQRDHEPIPHPRFAPGTPLQNHPVERGDRVTLRHGRPSPRHRSRRSGLPHPFGRHALSASEVAARPYSHARTPSRSRCADGSEGASKPPPGDACRRAVRVEPRLAIAASSQHMHSVVHRSLRPPAEPPHAPASLHPAAQRRTPK